MKTLEEAVTWLIEQGLVAEVIKGDTSYIMGGTDCTRYSEFSLYYNTFQIEPALDGWRVTVVGPGQLDTTEQSRTLADAVKAVQRILKDRGACKE